MSRRALPALLLMFSGCGLTKNPEPEFPIEFELPAGAQKRVPYAATLWFAHPDEVYENGRIIPVAVAQMECQGQRYNLTLRADVRSEAVCGVHVKLVSILAPGSASNPSRVVRGYFSVTKAQ